MKADYNLSPRFVYGPGEHCPSAQRDRLDMTTKIIPPSFITQSEEVYDKGYDPKVARGLLQFLKPYYGQMVISLVFMIVITAASISGPYFVKLAIDEGIAKKDISVLRNISLIYFAVAFIQLVLNIFRVRLMSRVG